MDYPAYKELYQRMISAQGREELGERRDTEDKVVGQINAFMRDFPKLENPDLLPETPVTRLTLREIYRRSMVTAIDILQDVSRILSERDFQTSATVRRQLFEAFTAKDRRLYVGLWILFFSVVVYLLDSAA